MGNSVFRGEEVDEVRIDGKVPALAADLGARLSECP
jgi:hypothetical protein